jgi:hypothetical protein
LQPALQSAHRNIIRGLVLPDIVPCVTPTLAGRGRRAIRKQARDMVIAKKM